MSVGDRVRIGGRLGTITGRISDGYSTYYLVKLDGSNSEYPYSARQLEASATAETEIRWGHDIIYLCSHVSIIVGSDAEASVKCHKCGRSYPTPPLQ